MLANDRLPPGQRLEGSSTNPAPAREASDEELLGRFVREQDGEAFEALVWRYGPKVLAVCRRVLGCVQDAEDAFQATFMVLARRAGSIGRPELLGNWLHGVALRTARKTRGQALRHWRGTTEAPDPARPDPLADPLWAANWQELCTVLSEELGRLPTKYRIPIVLCYLEGLTNEKAARRLGWPPGSMSYRLARGRQILRERLARYDE